MAVPRVQKWLAEHPARENPEAPLWSKLSTPEQVNYQQYLSFKQDRKIRVAVRTKRTLFHVDVYDIPADEVDVDALAEALDVPVEDVRAESDDLRGGRPGVRITCRGGGGVDIEALREEVERLLKLE